MPPQVDLATPGDPLGEKERESIKANIKEPFLPAIEAVASPVTQHGVSVAARRR